MHNFAAQQNSQNVTENLDLHMLMKLVSLPFQFQQTSPICFIGESRIDVFVSVQYLNTCMYLCVHSRMPTEVINGPIKKVTVYNVKVKEYIFVQLQVLDWASEVRSGMTSFKFPSLTV